MDQAEASGKTVEDALTNALAILGANRDEVELTVLDEGRRGGLFGRGAKDAVVRVERRKDVSRDRGAREPGDTRATRGPQQRGQGRGAPARSAGAPARSGSPRGGRPRGGAGYETPQPRITEEDFVRRPPGSPDARPAAQTPQPSRERGDRPRPERPRDDRSRDERPRRPREAEPHVDPDINAPEVDYSAHLVDDVLRILDIDAELTIREPVTPGDGLGSAFAVIDIEGEDLGLLIGRRGDTLAALQYLVNLALNKHFPDRAGVTIDVEHYRHRREDFVVAQANRMADRVRETGSAITLEPMSPAERRLVHLTLAEDPELTTNSIGEGENRKVVISRR